MCFVCLRGTLSLTTFTPLPHGFIQCTELIMETAYFWSIFHVCLGSLKNKKICKVKMCQVSSAMENLSAMAPPTHIKNAAIIPGMHIQGNDESVSNFGAQIYRPVLHPSEALPLIGTYTLAKPKGEPCIKATLGAQYIVTIKKKSWYYNLDPSKVLSSGYCHKDAAVLSLTLLDDAASLQFIFKKENNLFYVTKLTASVSPRPVCLGCANKTYSGLVERDKLFAASFGQSFKCKSANVLLTSSELSLKLVPLQMQAFSVPNGRYGEEVECFADLNKRVVPTVLGAIVIGLLLIATLTFLFVRDRHRHGYDSL
uniref:lysosome-associated membrane glycoprotein 2 isoform X2 n=1 Tax=Doryrhamphus excisus TaxID=161450 RepID=UPI0025AE3C4D|nr:lysosome-associated membrane glycoprotein 2 isoform X2 [Doryrhamphus excisus]